MSTYFAIDLVQSPQHKEWDTDRGPVEIGGISLLTLTRQYYDRFLGGKATPKHTHIEAHNELDLQLDFIQTLNNTYT